MKKSTSKPREPRRQRTFGFDSLGVTIRVFKTAQNAGAANIDVPQPTERLERCAEEFGFVTFRCANNITELVEFNESFIKQGYATNFSLMQGNVVLSYTADIKKALKFLKGSNHI